MSYVVEKMSVYRVLLSAPQTGGRVSVAIGAGGPAPLEDGAWTTEELDDELEGAGGATELEAAGGDAELEATGDATELETTGGAAELEAAGDATELETTGGAAELDEELDSGGRTAELDTTAADVELEATGETAVLRPGTVLEYVTIGV